MTSPQKYRVLFFIGSMAGGGAERQMVELLKRVDRSRFTPLLYLHHAKGEFLQEVPEDVPVISFWDNYTGTLKSKWDHLWGVTERSRVKHLANVIQQHNIDLVFDQTLLATLDSYFAQQLVPTARISTCVGSPTADIEQFQSSVRFDLQQTAMAAYRSCQNVVAVSEGLKSQILQTYSLNSNQMEVLPNLVDVKRSLQLAQQEQVDFPDDAIHLLTVGRMSAEKGHSVFLNALNLLTEKTTQKLHWHLVGQGPLQANLQAKVHELGLEHRVTFHGFQANPFPYYGAANLLVVPSLHEAFGNILIEALACQRPVLATKCPGGPREILQDGKFGGLAEVNDPESLCNQVLHFLDHQQQWQQQARLGYEHVLETYSYEQGMSRWESLFIQAIEEFQSA